MEQISILQILGLIFFVIIGASLYALQQESMDKHRYLIFSACIASFIGTGIVGYLAYVPTPIVEYEDKWKREGGAGGAGGSGGSGKGSGSSAGKGGKGGGGGNQADGSGDGGGEDGEGVPDGGIAVRDDEQKPGDTFKDCAECPKMVVLPKGEMILGSPTRNPDLPANEKPQYGVNIFENFAVSVGEITVAEFSAFANDTGFAPQSTCNTDGVGGPRANYLSPAMEQSDKHPVVCISFLDGEKYTVWLSKKTGRSYRLLSESEWEYARHGAKSLADAQAPTDTPPETGNVRGETWAAQTTESGLYNANGFRVHDMLGNAAEWTLDCWHDDHTSASTTAAARTVTGDCSARAVRGGSWDDKPGRARPQSRRRLVSTARDWRVGLRVMRELDKKDRKDDDQTQAAEQ